jgi:putative transposase
VFDFYTGRVILNGEYLMIDIAVAESFFGTLKTEFIYPRIFSTRETARTFIAEYIEAFYNR